MYKDVSGSIRRTRTAEARKTIFRAEKPNTVYCQGLQPMGIRGNSDASRIWKEMHWKEK